MTTDAELTHQLAERVMGWEIYTEQEGQYDRWQRHLVDHGGFDSCFIDLDGAIWRYAGACYTIGAECRWRPLVDMNDAMQIVEHLRTRTTGPRYWCEMRTPWMDGDRYLAGFTAWAFTGWNGRPDFMALADSLPRAIALAALKTREGEV